MLVPRDNKGNLRQGPARIGSGDPLLVSDLQCSEPYFIWNLKSTFATRVPSTDNVQRSSSFEQYNGSHLSGVPSAGHEIGLALE